MNLTNRQFTTFVMLILLTVPALALGGWMFETKEQTITGSNQRVIEFAGRQWSVKSGCPLPPGSNCWSDSEESVWVEGGQLHLKLRKVTGVWYAAQVSTKICTQYGMHRFFTIGHLDQLDDNVVFALFLYKDDQTEMDIEFSKWGESTPIYNAQFVVQPWDKPGNQERFLMKLNGTYTTHYIDWQPASIRFKSIHGHHQEPPTPGHLIREWLYTGDDIPSEEEDLKIHINLWLFRGNPPANGQEVELIVKNAQLPPPGCTKVYLPVIVNS